MEKFISESNLSESICLYFIIEGFGISCIYFVWFCFFSGSSFSPILMAEVGTPKKFAKKRT